ncbi:PIG-L deacetylase family protein [Paenarthrobacter aurescens]|uniref:GlcNAc-PI de-N-acetylase n=1 Tax=Paenarthrobacter aurescens TaxID=43663 RepID=A0A4Y3NHV4_PAEAU|nr:PIG-L deacetylase family protein [Paenarthrobacter aurescens]UKA48540.1 PIG-L family deacetylase [Arthrobacter sp. FW305-123]MDO6144143.1 PIG-L family deacetylase [Paenarthrobacter aurescens]MDO6147990.1 PIG-L family deacetylase [Paenarthrobacter aurescens]MDO6159234.1 PIG-L family deacetylase [Paenarthrobacter aurescens]MDO6163218.1 PIG-L family deacetylase [Paenarthrobacter aurescens]
MPTDSTSARSPFDASSERVERVLCFTAHPDDIDFGAAGTIAAWTAAGVEVSYCIMTDGDAGGFDPADRERITELRVEEQRRAAALVGVTDIHYLHELDGYLEPTHGVIKQVVKLIRQIRPDIVLTMHPERNWDRLQKSHPDHLAAGEAVTRAVYPAVENPFAYPELAAEGLAAYKLPWLWFISSPDARENHFVDVSDQVEAKLDAIRVHASQHPDIAGMERVVRRMMLANGERAGLPAGTSAEAFHVVSVNGSSTIAGF